MLSHKVFGSGVSGLSTQALCQDVTVGISAAGTEQSDATELQSAVNLVSTVASGAGVILFSTAVAGDSQLIYNAGDNPLLIYPNSGTGINNLSLNASIILPVNTAIEFYAVSTTQWVAILSK